MADYDQMLNYYEKLDAASDHVKRIQIGEAYTLTRPKVGIYKSWIANMDEGWTRWLMEEYNFEVDTLHNADIQEGNLAEYHSIIIPELSPDGILSSYSIQEMPEEYTGGLGLKGSLALKECTEASGTLIAFDKASNFVIQQFGLPLRNAVDGLSQNEFFIPGSLIRSVVDTEDPLAYRMQDTVSAFFSRSFAFEIKEQRKEGEGGTEDIADAPKVPVDVVASYADENLLMSGWAMGRWCCLPSARSFGGSRAAPISLSLMP